MSTPIYIFSQTMGSEIVTIYVGKGRVKYSVHKKLLCSKSKIFDKAFNGSFSEAAKQEIDLPEDLPVIFELFLAWIYRLGMNNDGSELDTDTLVDLYLFADAKLCDGLKDKAMDLLQDGLNDESLTLEAHHIQKIMSNTTDRVISPIRSFCMAYVHYSLMWAEESRIDEHVAKQSNLFKLCPDIIEEYLHFQFRERNEDVNSADPLWPGSDNIYDPCSFHAHKAGGECSRDN